VTTLASWSVVDNTVATVGNSSTTAGQVTGVKAGNTTVTATLSGKTGQATVNVVTTQLVSIAVSPPTASVRAGQTYPFQATGTFDNTTTRKHHDRRYLDIQRRDHRHDFERGRDNGVATAWPLQARSSPSRRPCRESKELHS